MNDVFGVFEKGDVRDRDFEALRQSALRTFTVERPGLGSVTILAHYHDAGNHGRLSFVVVDEGGRSLISDVFSAGSWVRVSESTTGEQQSQFNRLREKVQLERRMVTERAARREEVKH